MIEKLSNNVLKDIHEIIKVFIEMQKEFGERRNYAEIQRRIREHILIADSGYFSTKNLYHLVVNKINALIYEIRVILDNTNIDIIGFNNEIFKNISKKLTVVRIMSHELLYKYL